MRISDWSSDVCSSDLMGGGTGGQGAQLLGASADGDGQGGSRRTNLENMRQTSQIDRVSGRDIGNRDMLILAGSFIPCVLQTAMDSSQPGYVSCIIPRDIYSDNVRVVLRSEEHTSELQSLMRTSYAVFCLKKKKNDTLQFLTTHL